MPADSHESLQTSLRPALLTHLTARSHPKTICPSEVARSLTQAELSSLGVAAWRDLMPTLRTLAFEMRDEGVLEVLQRGEVVGGEITQDEVRGPIRLRLVVGAVERGGDGDGE